MKLCLVYSIDIFYVNFTIHIGNDYQPTENYIYDFRIAQLMPVG